VEDAAMPDEKLGTPVPVALAMVVCDAIYQDPATKKCTLLGTFSTITARRFPVAHPQLAVHVALTDGRGNVRIKLALVGDSENHPPLFSGEGVIHFADPRVVAELNFQLSNVTFPKPGAYRFQLSANNELLMERRLLVLQGGQPPPEPLP
jgi:hypothetical protein